MKKYTLITFLLFFSLSCWKDKSPENLPRLKESFQKQVNTFEKKKEQTNENVQEGLSSLGGLKEALEESKNKDKEFAKVYGNWQKVDNRVNSLNKEYEDLKKKAENLFAAMEDQTNSLQDQKHKAELLAAISKTRRNYNKTLANTSVAIEKLRKLHGDALDVVKALEVAETLNSFSDVNSQLESIENRVGDIMVELNQTVAESKKLYEKRIDDLN